ncbi:MAG: D-arabinono-1,4-lactone oxidase [Pseudomonadales bacterium]
MSNTNERWRNWSGKQTAKHRALHFLRSEADAAALVKQAHQRGGTVRAVGGSHSHSDLVSNEDVIVDLSGLSGIVSTDSQQRTARVRAGTPIYALGAGLHAAGLALHNQGDIDRQSIAGAVATGTHGSGQTMRNLSSAVIGATLVLADGSITRCSADQQPELFAAARLNLGALGLVTELELQLRDSYRLQEAQQTLTLTEALACLPDKIAAHRHCEFFWYPQSDRAQLKTMDETDEPAQYPLGAEGSRCAQSFEVLPNHRPHLHTEMEYSVPAEAGPDCMRAIAQLLRGEFSHVRWPVEYRTLAADDVALSAAFERDTVTISVHEDIAADDAPYFAACEAIFNQFEGRPHWGKVHYLSGAELAQRHPRWEQWWQVRDQVDPDGLFLNPYLRGLRT